jgi:hypothetical protein
MGKSCYILWPLGIFYDHCVHFMIIWYILCSFGTFFPVLVSCTKKNLATLVHGGLARESLYHIAPKRPWLGRWRTIRASEAAQWPKNLKKVKVERIKEWQPKKRTTLHCPKVRCF